ncbi:MAG TPA: hypothetical protein VM368_01745 [Flavisolibacter sp.]|nr:hypothetical protein [Flavisolibacter sp.]
MWKLLNSNERVLLGDKIRFFTKQTHSGTTDVYTVIKTEQHFFQIMSAVQKEDDSAYNTIVKIVKYFDVGYYFKLEIWDEASTVVKANHFTNGHIKQAVL